MGVINQPPSCPVGFVPKFLGIDPETGYYLYACVFMPIEYGEETDEPPENWIPHYHVPVPSPQFNYRVYADRLVVFTNKTLGRVSSYRWNFGDGGTSGYKDPIHTYSSPGVYDVTLTAYNQGGSDSTLTGITVANLEKKADFNYITGGLAAAFVDTSTVRTLSFSWDFGDGHLSAQQNPSHLYTEIGTYTVTLNILAIEGFYTVSKDITVTLAAGEFVPLIWTNFVNTEASPNGNDLQKISGVNGVYNAGAISITQITSAIAGAGVKFYVDGNTGYGDWTGGPACGLSHDNPDNHYTEIDFCIATMPSGEMGPHLWVYENGVEKYDAANAGTGHFSIIINAEGKIEYQEDGITFYTSENIPVFPLIVDSSLSMIGYGQHLKDAQINTGGGESPAENEIMPLASFDYSPHSGIIPLTVNFIDTSSGNPDEWLWEFGDGITLTTQNPSHIFTIPGIYSVRLTVTNTFGSDSKTSLVIVTEYIEPPSPPDYGVIGDWIKTSEFYFCIDIENDRILKYDLTWTYIGYFGDGMLLDPTTLCAVEGASDYLWVVDPGHNRIVQFDFDGTYISTFGTEGTGDGEFQTPWGIDTTGYYLYVTDAENNRVQVFDLEGNYIEQFGTEGSNSGEFDYPCDIAIDDNFMYITDKNNHRFQIFTLSNEFLYKIGYYGSGQNEFNNPTFCRDDELFIYITDTGNNRVVLYPKNFLYGFEPLGLSNTLTLINDINSE